VRDGGTGLLPPGVGPGLIVGVGGALLVAQPPITSITIEDNGFRRWYTAARALGAASIALVTLSVAFNLYWRPRYLFVTNGDFGGHDVAVIITTLLYGAVAMIALVIASRWLLEKSAAARLATTALGASAALASTLVWLAGIGRDVDAFHAISENTSTAAVGYEGYLFWAAAAAIVAPTTLYAVFLIKTADAGCLPLGGGEVPDTHRVLGVRRRSLPRRRLPDRTVAGSAPRSVRHRGDDGVQPDHRRHRAVAATPTRQG
jgi:hypothetical protein